jgi:chromatin remodeling complex protein RSC6
MRPVKPDEKLSVIIGSDAIPRSELTKRLWNYIRKHGLQDSKRKTTIHADQLLKPVFNGRQQVTMLELPKLVFSHTVQE